MGHKYRRRNQRTKAERRAKGLKPMQRKDWSLSQWFDRVKRGHGARSSAYWYKGEDDDRWHHRVQIHDGHETRVYLDGQRAHFLALPAPDDTTPIRDSASWDRALSQSEIRRLYEAGSDLNTSDFPTIMSNVLKGRLLGSR